MLDEFLNSTVYPLLEDLDTPVSLGAYLRIKAGQWDSYLTMSVDPRHYNCPEKFFKDNMAVEFLRKCKDIPVKGDLKADARAAFVACEKQCHLTNLRLQDLITNVVLDGTDERIFTFVKRARKIVAKILGPLPADLIGRHGPGATYRDKGNLTTILDKMSSRPTLTPNASWVESVWVRTSWFRALATERPSLSSPEYVPGNRFTTVPKDATKLRGICIEPSLNVFHQLGLGRVIRDRLKRFGIDLDGGQSIHRASAREASRTGDFATIDLSSASDTVAKDLVKLLLPEQWFTALDSLRSGKTEVNGKWYCLEKFSSMGNGFTFELETLVFLSLLWALDDRLTPGLDLLVYGDDIIIPTILYKDAVAMLRYFGFTPNPRKSFGDTYFRESCGGDFFMNQPVRAHYVKEIPTSPPEWIALANGLRRVVSDHNGGSFGLGPVRRAWASCLAYLPSDIRRCRGPAALGDLVITDYEANWTTRTIDSIRYVRTVQPQVRRLSLKYWSPLTVLAGALLGTSSDGVSPRGAPLGYRLKWTAYS